MYESYFGFSESPFENNLDHRFLFVSDDHKEILAALTYFIKTKKGFAIVCGDVGTGKTMLINSFLGTLPEYVQPIIVANPGVTSLELLRYIAKTLKIEVADKDGILELTDAVKELLQQAKSLNKQFVLIIDEAHLLSDQALEEIRLLSNIETEDQKLLQILLVGQYELSYKLDRPQMRHLRQRININRFLSPMNSFETRQYVDHRLRLMGSAFSIIFADNCASAIYKMTSGVPRNINQLCDNALLICMGEGRQKVDRKILRKAQEALLTDRLFTPPKIAQQINAPRRKLPRLLVWTAVCATFLVLWIDLSQTSFLGNLGQQLYRQASHLTGSVPDPKAGPPSGSVALSRESSSKVVFPEGQTSQNSAITPAVPPSVSLEPPGPPNLPPASQPEARESSAATPKVLPSIKEGPEGGTVPEKVVSPSRPPGPLPKVAEPLGLPAQVKKLSAYSDNTPKRTSRRRRASRRETPQDNLYYAYYERLDSADAMEKVTSLLKQEGVKFSIVENDGQSGTARHRIIVGGYETEAELQKALDLVKPYRD